MTNRNLWGESPTTAEGALRILPIRKRWLRFLSWSTSMSFVTKSVKSIATWPPIREAFDMPIISIPAVHTLCGWAIQLIR